MKNELLKEIKKDLNFKERIIVKLFSKTFIKIYEKGKTNYFKSF